MHKFTISLLALGERGGDGDRERGEGGRWGIFNKKCVWKGGAGEGFLHTLGATRSTFFYNSLGSF